MKKALFKKEHGKCKLDINDYFDKKNPILLKSHNPNSKKITSKKELIRLINLATNNITFKI